MPPKKKKKKKTSDSSSGLGSLESSERLLLSSFGYHGRENDRPVDGPRISTPPLTGTMQRKQCSNGAQRRTGPPRPPQLPRGSAFCEQHARGAREGLCTAVKRDDRTKNDKRQPFVFPLTRPIHILPQLVYCTHSLVSPQECAARFVWAHRCSPFGKTCSATWGWGPLARRRRTPTPRRSSGGTTWGCRAQACGQRRRRLSRAMRRRLLLLLLLLWSCSFFVVLWMSAQHHQHTKTATTTTTTTTTISNNPLRKKTFDKNNSNDGTAERRPQKTESVGICGPISFSFSFGNNGTC